MKKRARLVIATMTLFTASSIQLSAVGQTMTPDEYVSALPHLRPMPTTDTTPIKIQVGSVVYEIPRNYVKTAVELMPTLWITYPQFQPPTPETHCSSKNQLPVGPSECVIIELTIHGNKDGLLGYALPNFVLFERMIRPDPNTRGPFTRPSGMQFYTQGNVESHYNWIYTRQKISILYFIAASYKAQIKWMDYASMKSP